MQTLRRMISRYMQKIILSATIIILILIVGMQVIIEQQRAYESAVEMFHQMEQVLEENHKELKEREEEYKESCLNNAKAIAYLIQQNSLILGDLEELRQIAKVMEVDEIHIFDETGRIFTGTHPEYYNYTFDSGEQMMFFKPLLEDKTLGLVQEITPNTAEQKMMQYSAIWSKNREFIVQIGMEPISVKKVIEKNELSHIFSLFRVNTDVDYYAINVDTGIIVGATSLEDVDKKSEQVGLSIQRLKEEKKGFHAEVKGIKSFCIFEQIGSNYIGRVISNEVLYQRIPNTSGAMLVCVVAVTFLLLFTATNYMNRYVVDDIRIINEKLHNITKGNLDEKIDIQSSVEFFELSNYLNDMIKSLLDNNKKMSYVLSKTDMYIGVYEYNENMEKVHFTEYIPKIFALDDEEVEYLSADYKRFQAFLKKLYKNSIPGEKGVFKLEGKEHYVKLEEVNEANQVFGVMIDVTEDVLKRRQILQERDIDLLTGLYNRRGMENKLSELFEKTSELRNSVIIMIDADGLKGINDKFGHEKGDMYIQKVAELIYNFGSKQSISARQGGDEFVLFLYGYDEEKELMQDIEQFAYLQNHSSTNLGKDLEVPLRFSFGYSLVNGETDYMNLLKEADERMYINKRERRRELFNLN